MSKLEREITLLFVGVVGTAMAIGGIVTAVAERLWRRD